MDELIKSLTDFVTNFASVNSSMIKIFGGLVALALLGLLFSRIAK